MERRIATGIRVNGALAALMRRRNVSTAARLAVHNTLLVPTLLYGSETWKLQKKNKIKINGTETLSLGIYKEVDDSGRCERSKYTEIVALGAPFSLNTPQGIRRKASLVVQF